MAKKADPLPETDIVSKEVSSDREKRWKEHVENYAKANPVKFATKKANKEFDTIPASFR